MTIKIKQGDAPHTVKRMSIKQNDTEHQISAGFIQTSDGPKVIYEAITPKISKVECNGTVAGSTVYIGDTLYGYRGSNTLTNYDWSWQRSSSSDMSSPTLLDSGINATSNCQNRGPIGPTNQVDKKYYQYWVNETGGTDTPYKSNIVKVVRYSPVFMTHPSTSPDYSVFGSNPFIVKSDGTIITTASAGVTQVVCKLAFKVTTSSIDYDTVPEEGYVTWYDNNNNILFGGSDTLTIDQSPSSAPGTLTSATHTVPSGITSIYAEVLLINSGGSITKSTYNTISVAGAPSITVNPTFTGTGQSGTDFSITGGTWSNATTVTRYIEGARSAFTDPSIQPYSPTIQKYGSTSDGTYTVTNSDALTNSQYMRGVVIAVGPGGTSYWTSNGQLTSLSGSVKTWIQPTVTTPTLSQSGSNVVVSWTAGPSGYTSSSTVLIYDSVGTLLQTVSNATSPYSWGSGSIGSTYKVKVIVYADDYNSNTATGYTSITSGFSSTITLVPPPGTPSVEAWNFSNATITGYFSTSTNTTSVKYRWVSIYGRNSTLTDYSTSSNTAYSLSFSPLTTLNNRGTFPTDTYSSSTTYYPGNTVVYRGNTYTYYVSPSSGHLPTDTAYWNLTTSVSYSAGDYVTYQGTIYVCASNTTGTLPTNTSYWITDYGYWYLEVTPYNGSVSGTLSTSSWVLVSPTSPYDVPTVSATTESSVTSSGFTYSFTPSKTINRAIIDITKNGISISGFPKTVAVTSGVAYSESVSGLDQNTAYIVSVTPRYVYSSYSFDGVQTTKSITTAVALPTIPTSLTATTNRTDGVNLTFSGSTNATSYDIFWSVASSPAPSSGATPDFAGVSSPYLDSTIAKGNTRYYWVRGKNSVGTSAWYPLTTGVTGTRLTTVPGAPVNLTINYTSSDTLGFTWDSIDNGGSSITTYQTNLNGGTWYDISGPGTWSGLSPSTTYTIGVRGVNANGNGTAAYVSGATAAPPQYTVTWNANGGSVSPTSSTVNAGSSVTAPTPTRSGYTFDGWYTAASGGTLAVYGGGSYTPASSVTLYAHWTAFVGVAPVISALSVSPSTYTTGSVGSNLTANITISNYGNPAVSPTYSWSSAGGHSGTGSTYTIQSDDVGSRPTVTTSGTISVSGNVVTITQTAVFSNGNATSWTWSASPSNLSQSNGNSFTANAGDTVTIVWYSPANVYSTSVTATMTNAYGTSTRTASSTISRTWTDSKQATIAAGSAPSTPTGLINTYAGLASWTGSWTASTGTAPITYYWTLYQSATYGGAITATASGSTTGTSFSQAMTYANGTWAYFTVYAHNSIGDSSTATSGWA